MLRKIAVITSTRAEFGLLMPVLKALRKSENDGLRVELIVTGTHLYDEYGHTVDDIDRLHLRIDHYIKIPVKSKSAEDISANQAEALIKFTRLFEQQRYDAVVVLGDRYEMLAVVIAAGNTLSPVFHLCGGDTTEGAIDEWIRHSITKMSYLHFVTNAESYQRVIQLGENPERVFNYGSTSIDNIMNNADMSKLDALRSLGLENCSYAISTYHPVTMENCNIKLQLDCFLSAIKSFPEINFIMTKSNADQGGAYINTLLDEAACKIENLYVFPSLGAVRYLSLMKHACFVIGNSSSGIIEAPSFKIPTVNIGDRQLGRLQAESIINCKPETTHIIDAINTAMSGEFRDKCRFVQSPYGDGHAADRISAKIIEAVLEDKINLKKKFYNYRWRTR